MSGIEGSNFSLPLLQHPDQPHCKSKHKTYTITSWEGSLLWKHNTVLRHGSTRWEQQCQSHQRVPGKAVNLGENGGHYTHSVFTYKHHIYSHFITYCQSLSVYTQHICCFFTASWTKVSFCSCGMVFQHYQGIRGEAVSFSYMWISPPKHAVLPSLGETILVVTGGFSQCSSKGSKLCMCVKSSPYIFFLTTSSQSFTSLVLMIAGLIWSAAKNSSSQFRLLKERGTNNYKFCSN